MTFSGHYAKFVPFEWIPSKTISTIQFRPAYCRVFLSLVQISDRKCCSILNLPCMRWKELISTQISDRFCSAIFNLLHTVTYSKISLQVNRQIYCILFNFEPATLCKAFSKFSAKFQSTVWISILNLQYDFQFWISCVLLYKVVSNFQNSWWTGEYTRIKNSVVSSYVQL